MIVIQDDLVRTGSLFLCGGAAKVCVCVCVCVVLLFLIDIQHTQRSRAEYVSYRRRREIYKALSVVTNYEIYLAARTAVM